MDEDRVREWARDEWLRLDRERERERQARCSHRHSATIQRNGDLVCDRCLKVITDDDISYGHEVGLIERRAVEAHDANI